MYNWQVIINNITKHCVTAKEVNDLLKQHPNAEIINIITGEKI